MIPCKWACFCTTVSMMPHFKIEMSSMIDVKTKTKNSNLKVKY